MHQREPLGPSIPGLGEPEKVALAVRATEVTQDVRLLVGLYALGDRLDAEVAAQLDHEMCIRDRRTTRPASRTRRVLERLEPPTPAASEAALSALSACGRRFHTTGDRHISLGDLIGRFTGLLQFGQSCQDSLRGYTLHNFETGRAIEHERQTAARDLLVPSHCGQERRKVRPWRQR